MVVLEVGKRTGGSSAPENGQLVVLVLIKRAGGFSVLGKRSGGHPALGVRPNTRKSWQMVVQVFE